MSGISTFGEKNILLNKSAINVQALLPVLPSIVDWEIQLGKDQKVTLPWLFGGIIIGVRTRGELLGLSEVF